MLADSGRVGLAEIRTKPLELIADTRQRAAILLAESNEFQAFQHRWGITHTWTAAGGGRQKPLLDVVADGALGDAGEIAEFTKGVTIVVDGAFGIGRFAVHVQVVTVARCGVKTWRKEFFANAVMPCKCLNPCDILA